MIKRDIFRRPQVILDKPLANLPLKLQQVLATFCPSNLFPYAREAISGLVEKGGFPQLLLQPINFDALYAQRQEEEANANANAGQAEA